MSIIPCKCGYPNLEETDEYCYKCGKSFNPEKPDGITPGGIGGNNSTACYYSKDFEAFRKNKWRSIVVKDPRDRLPVVSSIEDIIHLDPELTKEIIERDLQFMEVTDSTDSSKYTQEEWKYINNRLWDMFGLWHYPGRKMPIWKTRTKIENTRINL